MEHWIKTPSGVNIFANDINPTYRNTIVFLHGWPANYKMFEYQYNTLGTMGYRLIGIDTRGFGNSEKAWDGYDYDTLADDLNAVIEKLNLRSITLLGHSTGGAIAARYMSRYKGFGVSRLVLAAAAVPSLVKRPGFPYGANESVVSNIIQTALIDRPKMLQEFGGIFFYNKISPAFSEWFFSLGLQAASWATISIAQTWLNEVLFHDLQSINVPTLIMHGVHDQIVPYQLGVIQKQEIKNSMLLTFEHSGHGLFYDEMARFNKELVQFTE